MAITTFDQYIGSFKQILQIAKTATQTTTAGNPFTVWDRAGFPAAGTLNFGLQSITNGTVPTDATTGAPLIAAPSGSNKQYLSRVEAKGTVLGSLSLYDVLFYSGQVTIPTTGTTTTTLTSQPSFAGRVPFKSDGLTRDYESHTELWAMAHTAWGNQAHTMSINYDGPGGNGLSTSNVSTQNQPIGRLLRLPWSTSGTAPGVSRINSFALNGIASATGAVVVMVMRHLWTGRIPIAAASYVDVVGPDRTGMPEIFGDSCLMAVVSADSTSSGLPDIRIEIAEG
jgi:hypothetical protein